MIGADENRDPLRFGAALRFVVRRYARQVRQRPLISIPALILPGVGDILVFYVPPLIVAGLLGRFARDESLSARDLAPFVFVFAGVWLAGEALWRIAAPFIARAEIRAMEALYVEAMDELLAKDLAFFQNNYAGSLTKRALGYTRRFEDVFDTMCFLVVPKLLPRSATTPQQPQLCGSLTVSIETWKMH